MDDIVKFVIFIIIAYVAIHVIMAIIEYKERIANNTYKGINYGDAKKSTPTYTLLNVEIDQIKSNAIVTIREEFGYRTVVKYRQKNYVKYPVLSEWKTKTKELRKTVSLFDCSEESLRQHTDETIRQLATNIAETVKTLAPKDIPIPEKLYEIKGQNNTVTVYKIESPKPTPEEEKKEYRLDGVEINAEKGFATVKFYDKIGKDYFDLGILLDDRSLERLEDRCVPISLFADEIRSKIFEYPEHIRAQAALQVKINQFWQEANDIAQRYAYRGEIDTLVEFLQNVWDTRDKETYAVELHFLLIKAINTAYPHREAKDENIDLILHLCELDISNYDNLNRLMNISKVSLTSPQKKVIILEKKRLYNEALDFSIWCKEHGILETRDKSFDDRIARLSKKMRR